MESTLGTHNEPIVMKIKRRVVREGCFFRGLNLLGYPILGLGGLIAIGGLVGFVSIFVKSASDIFSALQNLDQRFTLFVLTLITTYLGAFAGLGCMGLMLIGIGALFIFISTESMENEP